MCYFCGKALPEEKIGFRALCTCGKELHVCLNCSFYKPGMSNDCMESEATNVSEKNRMNFCEYFRPERTKKFTENLIKKDTASRSEFDSLFNS